jgi:ABC-type arginine transport system ATPase subunit
MTAAELLVFEGARLRLRDGSQRPPLSARCTGSRVAMVGAFGPFFGLLTGDGKLAGGTVHIAGQPAEHAVRRGVVGLALLDPPVPPGWTAERYLIESARLLGHTPAAARTRARDLLAAFELSHLTLRMLKAIPIVERRAFTIAHATLANPPVVCCEAPFDRLDGEAAAYVAARLERALVERAGIVQFHGVPATGAERAWIDRADTVLRLEHDQIVASAPPDEALAPSARLLATVARRGAEFRSALAARGVTADPVGHLASLLPVLTSREGATLERFLIVLPDAGDTRAVLEAARAAQAPLVELRPIEGGIVAPTT